MRLPTRQVKMQRDRVEVTNNADLFMALSLIVTLPEKLFLLIGHTVVKCQRIIGQPLHH